MSQDRLLDMVSECFRNWQISQAYLRQALGTLTQWGYARQGHPYTWPQECSTKQWSTNSVWHITNSSRLVTDNSCQSCHSGCQLACVT